MNGNYKRLQRFCLHLGVWFFALPALGAHVNVIELDNRIITPVTQRYIEDAIDRSERERARCLVIQLDTPGGLMESTRAIVKRIMNAGIPVVVYVAPSGSRAGSAGVFITLAAHVAAMAPSTNIGAAHPVGIGDMSDAMRKSRKGKEGEVPAPDASDPKTEAPPTSAAPASDTDKDDADAASPMEQKILHDTVAWIRTIAHARGRNEQWAEKAVTQSVSITEEEALRENVIDLIAKDLPDLLGKIEGRTVRVRDIPTSLTVADAGVIRIPMTGMQKFLAIITHPNIAYLLMMLGTLGLIFEFTHPGIGFPGVAGLICLLLALYSFQILPVSLVAIALLLLGLALLIAEVKIVSYGLLTLGGAVCLTLGSLMLFQAPDPALRVSIRLILPTVAMLALIVALIVHRAARSFRYPVATGREGLIGEIGEVRVELNPEGKIFVHGEYWNARCAVPATVGQRVRVVRAQGLTLEVEPVAETISRQGA